MKRNTQILLFFLAVFLIGQTKAQVVRAKFNFNSGWKLFVGDPADAHLPEHNDTQWRDVTLPHSWNEDDAFRLAINKLPKGIAWYRKEFVLPVTAKGQKVFLEFEGLRQAGTVFINGKQVMLHEDGVMAFGVDVTDVIVHGRPNTIAVKTDNSGQYREKATGVGFQWNHSSFYVSYGGLNKNVHLHVVPTVYQTLPLYNNLKTTGVYIYAADINLANQSARIHAESQVRNESNTKKTVQYNVVIRDKDQKVIASFTGDKLSLAPGETSIVKASELVENLNFWSWGYGYLYDVTTALLENGKAIDEVVTRTGFRKTGFGDGLVKLNDRVIQLKGYAQRSTNEWPAIGNSVPAWLSDYSNRLVIEGNGNFFRWMHVTPWKQDVESSDRVGLIQVMPAGDSEKDVQGRQWEQRVELMRDAIIYNRNNPSILFYECGNKEISFEHMEEMKAIRDQYDLHGGRSIGSREMLDVDNAEWGGEMLYINHSAKHPMWATEYMRDEGLRKYWDEQSYPYHKHGDGPLYRDEPATVYNQNQDMLTLENIRRWFDYYEARPGTGRRVSAGGAKIIFSDSNTHMRGAESYRRSGVVDPMRIAKDGFGAHKVMWDGWVDNDKLDTYIIGHWNYGSDVKKDVYVVSGAPKVVLYLNNKAIQESKREYNFLRTFEDVAFEAGELKAVSYDADGKELSSYILKTAGAPAAIRLNVMQSPDGMMADGHDLAMVEVEVVDKDGNRCPLANDLISFDLQGPATWRGGIAQGENNYILARQLPVECGVNRVLLRSTTDAGRITLKATGANLAPATMVLQTKDAQLSNGLSPYFQAANLPFYLDKGPTPRTPSFVASRQDVKVQATKAGANDEAAKRSYDDNERSQWTNDGKLATAWISYTLEREADLSAVVAKFSGWRNTSYPIEVFVDGERVWQGSTPRNLGYATMNFEPKRGKEVLIRMVGDANREDAFSGITEVDPTVDLDDFNNSSDPNAKAQLRINEIEFYEKAK